MPAAELGLHIHPRGSGYVLPVIGGFVGGDTVAGILATGLADRRAPDAAGRHRHQRRDCLCGRRPAWAASTAAGPAFEGARISQGMRGSTGAIEKVVVDGRLRINVIGNVPPVGLCGSGLIDAAAELLRHGMLTPQGRLLNARPTAHRRAARSGPADRRCTRARRRFLLADEAETAHGRPILLTQRDLRELQLATRRDPRRASPSCCEQAGLEPHDLERVLVGGGFGNFIRRSNAQRIGLLAAAASSIAGFAIRATRRWPARGWRPCRVGARQLADEIWPGGPSTSIFPATRFSAAFADAMIFPEA